MCPARLYGGPVPSLPMGKTIRNSAIVLLALACLSAGVLSAQTLQTKVCRWHVRMPVSKAVLSAQSLFPPRPAEAALDIVEMDSQPVRRTPPGAETTADTTTITAIKHTISDSRLNIAILTKDGSPRFSAFSLESPARIVVDIFAEENLPTEQHEIQLHSPCATRIRTGFHPDRGIVRTVIDTTDEYLSHYDIEASTNGVRVIIGG